jgi:hypothetical protein
MTTCPTVAQHRSGSELALWLRLAMKRVDQKLVAIYQKLQPSQKPAVTLATGTTPNPRK